MGNRATGLTEPAPGVHRLDVAHVNCYLVRTDDGLTLVDAGLPRSARLLDTLLKRLGARRGDIDAVVLTHGHFDHVGMVRALVGEGVPAVVHPADRRLVRHPYRYAHEAPIWSYPLRHPQILPTMAAMAWNGALTVRGADVAASLADGEMLDVPGHPRVIATPGHTDGHCALFFEHLGVMMCGDALVTLDPYTGHRGPQIVAGAATADSPQALASLEALRQAGERILLPGHGDPWTGGASAAIDAALRLGAH
ncbi:MBL fold metallo-hydrolase [Microbacterium sp. USHLN186]|uniref:MBL fold metallo-hydrolase n=1 Tax=Microbacterium sp. USHLN186 TaxID=3081286 RepID=UPI0030170E43